MLPCDAAANVHYRGRLEERAAIVTAAEAARDERCADQREAYLTAVDVSRQYEIDVVPACPGHIVRRVAQAEAKTSGRTTRHVRRRREPRSFMSDYRHRLAAHVACFPGIAEHAHAHTAQAAPDHLFVAPGIGVSENREGGQVPAP